MIKNVIFDMGNVLLRFDRDYFLDAVGVQGADIKKVECTSKFDTGLKTERNR